MTARMNKNTVKRMILFWTFQRVTLFLGCLRDLGLPMGFRGSLLPGSFPGALTTWMEMLDIFQKKDKSLIRSHLKLEWSNSHRRHWRQKAYQSNLWVCSKWFWSVTKWSSENLDVRAGKIAQWVKVLATKPGDLSLTPPGQWLSTFLMPPPINSILHAVMKAPQL